MRECHGQQVARAVLAHARDPDGNWRTLGAAVRVAAESVRLNPAEWAKPMEDSVVHGLMEATPDVSLYAYPGGVCGYAPALSVFWRVEGATAEWSPVQPDWWAAAVAAALASAAGADVQVTGSACRGVA